MRLPSLLLGVLLAASIGTTAQARLGETVDELTARYGQGANAGAPTPDFAVAVMMFHKQGWTIMVSLIDGKSAGEKFQKSGGVDDDSVKTLLDLNSEGHVWTLAQSHPSILAALLPTPNSVGKQWTRDDGATATLPAGMRIFLNIESKQLLDAEAGLAAAQKKARESSLSGF